MTSSNPDHLPNTITLGFGASTYSFVEIHSDHITFFLLPLTKLHKSDRAKRRVGV